LIVKAFRQLTPKPKPPPGRKPGNLQEKET
jgi:hypothetical protein